MDLEQGVLASDPYIPKERFEQFGAIEAAFDELIHQSNAILFHCPPNKRNQALFNREQFTVLQEKCILCEYLSGGTCR